MLNTKHLLTSLTLIAVIALAGCFPGVYKIDIQQGNVVTQDMIDELRPGMSKAQVRYIMGNPLITDTFHARRWDYLYSLQTGGGEKSQKRMSLYFNEGDRLIAVSGDFRLKPGQTTDDAILGSDDNTERSVEPIANTQPLPEESAPNRQEAVQTTSSSAALPEALPPPAANTAEAEPPLQFSDNRHMESVAPPPPGSVEEQIQRELDGTQPVEQQLPDPL